MLQQDKPEDFVLSTGKSVSVREFIELAFNIVDISIEWQGTRGSLQKIGVNKKTGQVLIKIDPQYFRPTEVDILLGNPTKAKKKLGWEAKVNVAELARIMVEADLRELKENNGNKF